jgi:hypothetical protein
MLNSKITWQLEKLLCFPLLSAQKPLGHKCQTPQVQGHIASQAQRTNWPQAAWLLPQTLMEGLQLWSRPPWLLWHELQQQQQPPPVRLMVQTLLHAQLCRTVLLPVPQLAHSVSSAEAGAMAPPLAQQRHPVLEPTRINKLQVHRHQRQSTWYTAAQQLTNVNGQQRLRIYK